MLADAVDIFKLRCWCILWSWCLGSISGPSAPGHIGANIKNYFMFESKLGLWIFLIICSFPLPSAGAFEEQFFALGTAKGTNKNSALKTQHLSWRVKTFNWPKLHFEQFKFKLIIFLRLIHVLLCLATHCFQNTKFSLVVKSVAAENQSQMRAVKESGVGLLCILQALNMT